MQFQPLTNSALPCHISVNQPWWNHHPSVIRLEIMKQIAGAILPQKQDDHPATAVDFSCDVVICLIFAHVHLGVGVFLNCGYAFLNVEGHVLNRIKMIVKCNPCQYQYMLIAVLQNVTNSSPLDKMAAICQTTIFNAFSSTKVIKFRFKFHWNLLPGVQLTMNQYWFR